MSSAHALQKVQFHVKTVNLVRLPKEIDLLECVHVAIYM